jgi:hypothetical protein
MSKAIYHPEAGREVEFDVISKNDDGTVNLAFEGVAVVTSCQITELPTVGACVLLEKSTKSKDK